MIRIILFAVVFFVTEYGSTAWAMVSPQRIVLANGFEAVLIENHSVPVVASVVTVKAGSANETLRTSGISHMLEHLLFNGTNKRTQKEIYEEADFYGIYNNAHTGRTFTNYIVLSEKGNAGRALDLQADMLFNSTIPAQKFKKEKGVILNEVAKDVASPSFIAEEQFNRHFFHGTPYNLPVIGIPDSIKAVTREEVMRYYKTFYVPNNAVATIMGDFETEEMIKLLNGLFGKIPPGKIPSPKPFTFSSATQGRARKSMVDVKKTTIIFAAPIPSIQKRDFYRLYIAAMLFDSTLKSELNRRLKATSGKEVTEAFAGVDFSRDFAFFRAELSFSADILSKKVEEAFYDVVRGFGSIKIDQKAVEGVLTSAYVEEVKLMEKPHYYGMMKGKFLASGGWDFNEKFIRRLENEKKLPGPAVSGYFQNMKFTRSVVSPGKTTYRELLPSIKEEYFNESSENRGFTPESLRLVEEWKNGKREFEIKPGGVRGYKRVNGKVKIKRVVLKNGLTVIVNSNPFSEVFAVHLLAKGRSLLEPEGKEGITEFLHRSLKKGTEKLHEGELKLRLSAIGAVLKTHDNRYIPFDDHYTKSEYSYMRFETVDRFAGEGLRLFSEILRNPGLRTNDIEQVRREIGSIIEGERTNPEKWSEAMLKSALFYKTPKGLPIMGTKKSIESISKKDLLVFHKRFFSPENLILTISTSLPPDEVMNAVNESFETMKNSPGSPKRPVAIKATLKGKTVKAKLGKPQSFFRVGKVFRVKKEERQALKILGALLSEKLEFELREKLGLVYSLGISFEFLGDFAVLKGRFGTRPETLNQLEKEVLKQLNTFDAFSLKERDIKRVVNLYVSKHTMRRLSRISQSYYLGVEEFSDLPPGATRKNIVSLGNVSLADVRYVAKKYVNTENLVKVIVE
ncbi:MAG: M16 family metallopeptidase [Nitrospinota bacterium]